MAKLNYNSATLARQMENAGAKQNEINKAVIAYSPQIIEEEEDQKQFGGNGGNNTNNYINQLAAEMTRKQQEADRIAMEKQRADQAETNRQKVQLEKDIASFYSKNKNNVISPVISTTFHDRYRATADSNAYGKTELSAPQLTQNKALYDFDTAKKELPQTAVTTTYRLPYTEMSSPYNIASPANYQSNIAPVAKKNNGLIDTILNYNKKQNINQNYYLKYLNQLQNSKNGNNDQSLYSPRYANNDVAAQILARKMADAETKRAFGQKEQGPLSQAYNNYKEYNEIFENNYDSAYESLIKNYDPNTGEQGLADINLLSLEIAKKESDKVFNPVGNTFSGLLNETFNPNTPTNKMAQEYLDKYYGPEFNPNAINEAYDYANKLLGNDKNNYSLYNSDMAKKELNLLGNYYSPTVTETPTVTEAPTSAGVPPTAITPADSKQVDQDKAQIALAEMNVREYMANSPWTRETGTLQHPTNAGSPYKIDNTSETNTSYGLKFKPSYGQEGMTMGTKMPYKAGGYTEEELIKAGNMPRQGNATQRFNRYGQPYGEPISTYEGYYAMDDGNGNISYYPIDQGKANYANKQLVNVDGTLKYLSELSQAEFNNNYIQSQYYEGYTPDMEEYRDMFGTYAGYTPSWRKTAFADSDGSGRSPRGSYSGYGGGGYSSGNGYYSDQRKNRQLSYGGLNNWKN